MTAAEFFAIVDGEIAQGRINYSRIATFATSLIPAVQVQIAEACESAERPDLATMLRSFTLSTGEYETSSQLAPQDYLGAIEGAMLVVMHLLPTLTIASGTNAADLLECVRVIGDPDQLRAVTLTTLDYSAHGERANYDALLTNLQTWQG